MFTCRSGLLNRCAADGIAPLEAQAARHVDVADQAIAHRTEQIVGASGKMIGSMGSDSGDITLWLERWGRGEAVALNRLTPLVYERLRAIAEGLIRGERRNHTLQPTALVHEAFQQLLHLQKVSLNDRAHFFTFAAKLMRRILIDHARRTKAEKRGGDLGRIPLNPELAWVGGMNEESLDLAAAFEELETIDPARARAVELRYFLGCTVEETAALLGLSPSTVDRSVRFSLAWLHDRLHPARSGNP